ncbi:MAG: hypothetical protein O3B84_01000 [Chloroflexi bacterium]|nr:hypothetical protein [Chloroflexota bacterium]
MQDELPCDVPNCWLGYENFVYFCWTANLPATWSADSQVQADAATVVSNWEASIPKLAFQQASPSDINFARAECEAPAAKGCIEITHYYYETTSNANYFDTAALYVDDSEWPTLTPTERRQVLAHELGHFYGLHERYIESPFACNGGEYTVMDALGCEEPPLEGPASKDVDRVNAYWGQGAMAWYQPEVVGSNIAWTWADGAWAETYQQFNAFWSYGAPNWDWVPYVQLLQHTDGIGLHNVLSQKVETPPRVMAETFGKEPQGTYHTACGHPYFKAFGVYGTWTCSPGILVPFAGLAAT